jgi:hypothetical protein
VALWKGCHSGISYFGLWLLVLAAVGGPAAIPAKADLLPPPTSIAHCTATPSFIQDPTACSISGTLDSASATAITSPFVSLTAEAFSAASPTLHAASAVADVQYSFQVTGGNPGDIVPILIETDLATLCTESVNSRCNAFSELNINTSVVGFRTLVVVCTDGTCGTTANSFSGTASTFARSGAVGDFLDLFVQAGASGSFSAIDESASASADPFIFIDPSFANASLYSIVVSPGVGNALPSPTTVPEPAPAVLFGLGILFCATAHRRFAQRT